MTKDQIVKHLENQIDYFVYELKREIINSAISGHQNQTIWDKFKGFMQNLHYGKGNVSNPNLPKNLLGHGLGSQANESRVIPLKSYRFFKEWHNNLELCIRPINENYSVPEIPAHLKNTQLNQIIDKWAVNFKRAIFDTIKLITGTVTEPTSPAKEKPTDEKPVEAKPSEAKPDEEKPVEEKPAEVKPSAEEPSSTEPTEEAPDKEKSADEAPVEETAKPNYIKANNLEEATNNYLSGKDVISTRAWNIRGGEHFPHPYKSKRKIPKTNIYLQDLPYVLRFGDPRIDLIYYADAEKGIVPSEFFKELLNLGRIETQENFYPHKVDEEIKKTILRNRFQKELKSSEGKALDEKKQRLKQETENIVFSKDSTLEQMIQKIQELHGMTKPKTETPSETEGQETSSAADKPAPSSEPAVPSEQPSEQPSETPQVTPDDVKKRHAKLNIESKIDSYFIFSPKDDKYTNFDKEKPLAFLKAVFETNKNLFSEKFEDKIKTLPEINYELANISNINNSSEIKDGLNKIENLDEFIATVKKLSNLEAIETFFSNSIEYKNIEKSTKGKVSNFIKSLSSSETEYLKTRFLEFIKKCTRNRKNNLPLDANKRSFESIENSINGYVNDKDFENLVEYFVDLIKHCHEKVTLPKIRYATSDEIDEFLGS